MRFPIIFISAVFSLMACGRFGNKEKEADRRQRIVCISKQYSEIIYALGAEQDLVAVDLSSSYPPEIKKLPTVGYHRALTAEGILAVKPDLILHDNNIGPEHVVRQLENLHIPMKVFAARGNSIDSVKVLIREMGAWFHREKRADSLCDVLDRDMKIALEKGKKYQDKPKVLLIHFGQASNVYLVMTKKSSAARMLEWAGAEMAIDDEKGMKQLSAEVVAAADPDVILLTDFGYDRLGSVQKIQELPGVAGTKAAKNGRIYRVEEHDLVYFGPRTGLTTLALQKLIHQNAEAAK